MRTMLTLCDNFTDTSDMVFSYKTLHLLRNLLFVDMFGMLSLLTLFILHAVY